MASNSIFAGTPIACLYSVSAATTFPVIGSGVSVIVDFDLVDYDYTGGAFTSPSSSQFVAPVSGFYEFQINVEVSSGAAVGQLSTNLYINTIIVQTGSEFGSTGQIVSRLITTRYMDAGDLAYFGVFNGGSLSATIQTSNNSFISIKKVD